jgi:uncharacterized membrane protein (UPF0127 family)
MLARNGTREVLLADEVRVADHFLARLRGLLGTRELPEGHGLLLVPCQSVHGLGMAYDVDVVHLARDGTVLAAFTLRRGRLGPVVRGSWAVLELPIGTLLRTGTRVGDRVELERQGRGAVR